MSSPFPRPSPGRCAGFVLPACAAALTLPATAANPVRQPEVRVMDVSLYAAEGDGVGIGTILSRGRNDAITWNNPVGVQGRFEMRDLSIHRTGEGLRSGTAAIDLGDQDNSRRPALYGGEVLNPFVMDDFSFSRLIARGDTDENVIGLNGRDFAGSPGIEWRAGGPGGLAFSARLDDGEWTLRNGKDDEVVKVGPSGDMAIQGALGVDNARPARTRRTTTRTVKGRGRC